MITNFFQALLAIPRLVFQIETLIKMMKRAEENHWFDKAEVLERKMGEAKSAQDKMESAKRIQDLISKS